MPAPVLVPVIAIANSTVARQLALGLLGWLGVATTIGVATAAYRDAHYRPADSSSKEN